MNEYHTPVLLQESISALNIRPDGIYVDATYGGGGHSKEILKKLKSGKLFVFDRDVDAEKNLVEDKRLIFIQQNFSHLKRFLKLYKTLPTNGIIADLGVSSHQFDTPARGFSLRFDAALDMRMDTAQTLTAREVLNNYEENDLVKIFSKYGEVRNSKTLASAIISARKKQAVETIEQFKSIAKSLVKGNENKYFAQVFQALRIEVNQELEALKDFLQQSAEVLKQGGRLVVISYHSLEDRLVKNFFRSGNFDGETEKDFFGNKKNLFKTITKKPITPSEQEIKNNPRARSAKMRVVEKI